MSLLVGGLACNAACAQVLGSSLSGKIGTSANSSVPNVTLTLKNASNAATQVVTVGEDGSFAIHNLSPGTYEITASAPGFAEAKIAVTIRPGADQAANIVMEPEATATADFWPEVASG